MRKCGCHSHNGMLLSPEGLAQRERQLDAFPEVGLTGDALSVSLDLPGSVSASELELIFDDHLLDQQHRRFLNGS